MKQFEDGLRKQPDSVIKDILGKDKGQSFIDGEMSLSDVFYGNLVDTLKENATIDSGPSKKEYLDKLKKDVGVNKRAIKSGLGIKINKCKCGGVGESVIDYDQSGNCIDGGVVCYSCYNHADTVSEWNEINKNKSQESEGE